MPVASGRPRPGRQSSLSREQIAETALGVVDRDGLEALSMKRLAGELGVGTMTLYGYFRTKDELLDAVVEAAADQYPLPELRGSWQDQLRALMRTLRDELVSHPAVVRVRARRPIVSTEGVLRMEAGIRALEQAGFSTAEAARGFRALFLYTFAFASFNVHADGTARRAELQAALGALDKEEHPRVSGAAAHVAATITDGAQFDYGLDCLLAGLEARLAEINAR